MSAPTRRQATTGRTPQGPFWLYRPRNALGVLLYIGKTNSPHRRYEQHCADKHWVREVARWDVDLAQSYATEADVLAAEESAIKTEKPLMNIEHNHHNPNRVVPHTMRYATTGKPYRPELYADVHAGTPRSWRPMPVGVPVKPKANGTTYRPSRGPRRTARRVGGTRRRWRAAGYVALWLAAFACSWWPLSWAVAESGSTMPEWGWPVAMAAGPTVVGGWWWQLSKRRRRQVLAVFAVVGGLAAVGLVAAMATR